MEVRGDVQPSPVYVCPRCGLRQLYQGGGSVVYFSHCCDEAGEFTRGPPEIEADPTDIARDSPDASGRGDL